MNGQAKRDLTNAAISLFGLIAICVLIKPASLSINEGISYFGNYKETLLPYSGAYVLTAWFLYQATNKLPSGRFFGKHIRQALDLIAILIVSLILVPSNGGATMDWIHRGIGSTIFSLELLMSAYWWLSAKKESLMLAFLLIEFFAGVASAFYVPSAGGFLLQAQLIFQAAYMAIFYRALTLTPA